MPEARFAVVVSAPGSGPSPARFASALSAAGYTVIEAAGEGDRFDGWAAALADRPELSDPEADVLLVGDGLIGPFDDAALAAILRDFETAAADVWSATDTLQHGPHLQTDLLGFRRGALADPLVRGVFAALPAGDLTTRELALDHAIASHMLTTVAWRASERLVQPGADPLLDGWLALVRNDFPFLSRRALGTLSLGDLDGAARLLRDRFGVELREWVAEHELAGTPEPPADDVDVRDGHHADFDRWLGRRSLRLKSDFPPRWRRHLDRSRDRPALAVVLHVFYPELLPELIERLAHLPVPFDLIVTNASGRPLEPELDGLGQLHSSVVLDVPNRGRDILPLVMVVNAGLLDGYDLVLKLHTKKSDWRATHADFGGEDGAAWRVRLLDGLVGSAEQVQGILGAFALDRRLGVLTAPGSVHGADFWGGDEHPARELLRRIQLELDPTQLRFASGSMYWIRAFLLQGLRAFDLAAQDFEPERGQVDGTTAHAIERAIGLVAREAGYQIVDELPTDAGETADAWRAWGPDAVEVPRARVVPFYLPQFHAFPENDEWWGPGFTEWSNVTAAQPLFPGHAVPLLPADLGFYDLLADESVRPRQYALAREAGLEGFMYYYYWFAGKRLMSAPVERLVASDDDHPFCLMWANENWNRSWDGSAQDVLIAQEYDKVPTERFIDDVMPLLKDERYIRVDGKPLLAVYKLGLIPDHESVLRHWGETAVREGLSGLHIVTVDVGASTGGLDGELGELGGHGVDAALEFPPHRRQWREIDSSQLCIDSRFGGHVLSYQAFATGHELDALDGVPPQRYPGVMVGFDNTARRQWRPDLWWGANPYTFRRWLDTAISAVADRDPERRMLFVNAWNEWAEGAVLEPTQRYGHSYLMAVRDALVRRLP